MLQAALSSRGRCWHRRISDRSCEMESPSPRRETRFSLCLFLFESRRSSTRRSPLRFTGPAKPSQPCDAPTCVPRPCPSTRRRCESERPEWIVLSVSPKNEFDSFYSSPPFRPFHWARLRGNSCARQLRLFCFSVSSQNILANNIEDVLCPSRNADPRLGSRPLSLSSAPITRAENGA
jgi:hypothetical protein